MPLILLIGVEVIQVQDTIRHYALAVSRNQDLKITVIQKSIQQLLSRMETASTVLSSSDAISKAIQKVDNEILFDISREFIDPIDNIIFVDIRGMVIARAPDEFRFGDSVSNYPWFRRIVQLDYFRGISTVDGDTALVISKPIRKYDDIPVGMVCVAVRITPELLSGFSHDPHTRIELSGTPATLPEVLRGKPADHILALAPLFKEAANSNDHISIYFDQDPHTTSLLTMRLYLYVGGFIVVLLLTGLLAFILRKQLTPYTTMIHRILAYAGDKIDAHELTRHLKAIEKSSKGTAANISRALVTMLEVISRHFTEIESYNQALEQANSKLEDSLKEVKKLSGLLPICSHCKKIRDDKGYWNQIETYIHDHSEAQFSHGICEECLKQHYPDYMGNQE